MHVAIGHEGIYGLRLQHLQALVIATRADLVDRAVRRANDRAESLSTGGDGFVISGAASTNAACSAAFSSGVRHRSVRSVCVMHLRTSAFHSAATQRSTAPVRSRTSSSWLVSRSSHTRTDATLMAFMHSSGFIAYNVRTAKPSRIEVRRPRRAFAVGAQ
jgi:hypothetical protein